MITLLKSGLAITPFSIVFLLAETEGRAQGNFVYLNEGQLVEGFSFTASGALLPCPARPFQPPALAMRSQPFRQQSTYRRAGRSLICASPICSRVTRFSSTRGPGITAMRTATPEYRWWAEARSAGRAAP